MRAVYFDLETDSLREDAQITQIAAIAVEEDSWRELGRFEAKVQFDESLAEPEALRNNHYDRDTWKAKAVSPAVALRGFAAFCEPHRELTLVSLRTGAPYRVARLVGHNAAAFDAPRLQRAYERTGLFLPCDRRVRCTMQRAIWYVEEHRLEPPKNYKLATLCEYFGIPVPENTHDALVDISLTVQLARKLAEGHRGFPVQQDRSQSATT